MNDNERHRKIDSGVVFHYAGGMTSVLASFECDHITCERRSSMGVQEEG